ncbi:unnamed protein product [Allacma fusca]|uniref:Uncharacterized protein n=1 Tax=Allacma fusca TaxID=39272 RepID=A0A8J2NRF5_9HEXA|nr:unnamed protein product [Allacma fusca]
MDWIVDEMMGAVVRLSLNVPLSRLPAQGWDATGKLMMLSVLVKNVDVPIEGGVITGVFCDGGNSGFPFTILYFHHAHLETQLGVICGRTRKMQRISSLLASQVLVILFVGSHAWSRQADESDLMKRMYSIASQYKRPMYDFGLGKRSWDEPASDEDLAYPSALDTYTVQDKRAAPNSMYSFGLGKRNRAYGFGLGKRLENPWKYNPISANRQERRSKIYSFGLGKRSSLPISDDYYDVSGADKRATANRQFSFGLGKRDIAEASHVNSTS